MRIILGSVLLLSAAVSGCQVSPPSLTATPTTHSQFPGGGRDLSQAMSGAQISCYYGGTKTLPAATILHTLETLQGVNVVHLRLTLDPDFVDNTWGANTVGWNTSKRGTHTWKDLVGSDHAELILLDGSGKTAVDFKLDYITADATAPSGYRSLGVLGGDGKMIVGDPASVVAWSSSMDRNLNERGYTGYLVDSPATDPSYAANAATPNWDYRVVYEAWVKLSALGPAGFGSARLTFIHASPSKASTNTVTVVPRECPHDWIDEGCGSSGCTAGTPPPPFLENGGGACTDGSGCLSGACSAGHCGLSDPGGPCSLAADCTSHACSNGMCGAGPLGGSGATCASAANCLSESCVGGKCGPGASGFACAASADCGAGLTCVNGYCGGGIN